MAGKNGRGRTGTGSKTPDFSSLPSRVVDYASRLTVKPELLTAGERRCSDRRKNGFQTKLEKNEAIQEQIARGSLRNSSRRRSEAEMSVYYIKMPVSAVPTN
ncbi:hypothetical protein BELL_0005g00120 [Botrytis elliptica]|uniref:Uncharacterized protein n=1 Tax=Botrytis elliptica TaxID=278938 RepID=A0A4Z1K347_9HELO|nr:hypothetical protein BELL_0005g00120 [Botrytis elliptica]